MLRDKREIKTNDVVRFWSSVVVFSSCRLKAFVCKTTAFDVQFQKISAEWPIFVCKKTAFGGQFQKLSAERPPSAVSSKFRPQKDRLRRSFKILSATISLADPPCFAPLIERWSKDNKFMRYGCLKNFLWPQKSLADIYFSLLKSLDSEVTFCTCIELKRAFPANSEPKSSL